MKLCYIANFKDINEKYIGVKKKIDAQINAFESNQIIVNKIDISNKDNSITRKLISRLPFTSAFGTWSELSKLKNFDCIYLRYVGSDYSLIKNLKKLKRKNRNSKIIIEIPTYPYNNESKTTLFNIIHKCKDLNNRRKLSRYIDRIVTYSNDSYIFSIKTIQISNGVLVESIKPKKICNSGDINIIAVASFANWHGYDRFIEGLGKYYEHEHKNKQNIYLHLVGDGEEVNNYKILVDRYKLSKNVIFYGRQDGSKLDSIYDQCDLALDAMGRHRSNVYYNSSLKGKEYMAKGLPIVSGVCTELDRHKDYNYYKRVPADDSSINIEEVVDFYNMIYSNVDKKDISNNIREYATKMFNINECIRPIIEYLE